MHKRDPDVKPYTPRLADLSNCVKYWVEEENLSTESEEIIGLVGGTVSTPPEQGIPRIPLPGSVASHPATDRARGRLLVVGSTDEVNRNFSNNLKEPPRRGEPVHSSTCAADVNQNADLGDSPRSSLDITSDTLKDGSSEISEERTVRFEDEADGASETSTTSPETDSSPRSSLDSSTDLDSSTASQDSIASQDTVVSRDSVDSNDSGASLDTANGSPESGESPDAAESPDSGENPDSGGSPDSGSPGDSPGGSKSSSSSSGSSDTKKRKKRKKRGVFRKLWTSSPEEYWLLKMMVWFPVGIGLSALLYYMVIEKTNMELKTKQVVGAGLGFVLSLSFAASVQMRCAMTLIVPIMVGKAGRTYISAFALIYLINGPITNIMDNGKDIVRSLSCTSALLANHTKTKWKLRLLPVETAFGDLAKDGALIKRASRVIERAFKPVRSEIEDNDDEKNKLRQDIVNARTLNKAAAIDDVIVENTKSTDTKGKAVEKDWEKKMDLRCEDTFSKGVVRCVEKLGSLFDKCYDIMWIIAYLLCWPLKISAFCNLVTLLPGAFGMNCQSMKVVNPGFGETFVAARAVIDDMDQGMDVKMQYKMVGDASAVDYTPVEEMRQATIHEVNEKVDLFSYLFSIVAHLLTFAFLIMFKSAYTYNKKYLTELSFDNIYITPYFRHIDARRRAQGKKTLLPLKKFESKEYTSLSKMKLSPAEKSRLISATALLMVRVFISAIICYMDSLLYQILDIVARNSRVEYHQTGEHVIDIKVYGTGFMSSLVRNFLVKFNTKHKLDQLTTNYDCLPSPSQTDVAIVAFLFLTYFVVWLFLYFEAFGLRLRRAIASFYYRKREKKRVLYLYNEMFRRRLGYLTHVRKKVRKAIKARELKRKVGLLVALQRHCPACCRWLRIFQSNRETCIICDDNEDEFFHVCTTTGCGLAYCEECWRDVKKKCYGCGLDTDSEATDFEDMTQGSDASVDSGFDD